MKWVFELEYQLFEPVSSPWTTRYGTWEPRPARLPDGLAVNQDALERIDKEIESAEEVTSVEIVVAIVPRSGAYRDCPWIAGTLLAFATLAVALFTPWVFHPVFVLADALAALVLGYGVFRYVGPAARLIIPCTRMRKQVRSRAMEVFYSEGLGGTKGRTGLLVFYSMFEDAIEILGDTGLTSILPPGEWNALVNLFRRSAQGSPDPLMGISDGIRKAAGILSAKWPAAGENPDEIPNHPRILP